MTVYLRTGQGSAVSFPLWFYVLAVLPLQVMWLFAKVMVVMVAVLSVGVFLAGRWVWRHSGALGELRDALPR